MEKNIFGRQGERLSGAGQSVVERISTNSAINPLLWLCAVVLTFTMPGAIWGPLIVSLVCLALSALAVTAPVAAYFIWMFRDPIKLQSEHYQLERQRIELIGDERLSSSTPIIDGNLIENPMIGGQSTRQVR